MQIKENIKAPRYWPLCGEFTGDRGPVKSPHKLPVTRNMFPFDDVIMCAVKRDMFLNVTLWLLCTLISLKISPVFANIYQIPDYIWATWALLMAQGASGKNDQVSAHIGQGLLYRFRIIKTGPAGSQDITRKEWSNWGFYFTLQVAIFYSILKVVQVSLKNKCHVQWKLFAK